MIWVQLKDGTMLKVPGNAWQVSRDVYDILEAPGKSVATLTKENVVGIFKNPPADLRREIAGQIVDKMEQELDAFLQRRFPGPEREDARRAIVEWLQSAKPDVSDSGL